MFNKNIIDGLRNISVRISNEKSLLNQIYPIEEAFAKGGNSDKVNLIPSLASNHIRTDPGMKSTSSWISHDLHHILNMLHLLD